MITALFIVGFLCLGGAGVISCILHYRKKREGIKINKSGDLVEVKDDKEIPIYGVKSD